MLISLLLYVKEQDCVLPDIPFKIFVSYNHLSPVFLEFITNMSLECVPKCLCKALPHPKWKEVVLDEMRAFENNKTWVFTSHRKGKYSIGCKWVFTLKYNLAGTIQWHKACLVPNLIYTIIWTRLFKTFSPVANLSAGLASLFVWSYCVKAVWKLKRPFGNHVRTLHLKPHNVCSGKPRNPWELKQTLLSEAHKHALLQCIGWWFWHPRSFLSFIFWILRL